MPSNKLNTSKRNAVRLALVTGSTLAAIIGAQNLAALGTAPSVTSQAAITTQSQTTTSQQQSFRSSGEADDDHEERATGISVLRPSGQTSTTSTQQSTTRRPTTHSSR
jgi:hypothetical protein